MFNYRQSQTKNGSTDKDLQIYSSINKLIATLPNINTNWKRSDNHKRSDKHKNREILGKVKIILSDILYIWIKDLQSDQLNQSVIDTIEPYMDKLIKTHNKPTVQGMYAWFLEKKMNYCKNEEEVKRIYQKILAIYQSIFKEKSEVALWITRVNYLNFLSRKSEGCIPIAEEFLKKAKTMAVKPHNKQLARIYTILAIEYEKITQYEKMYDNAMIAKNFDPNYAPIDSILGKYYRNQGEIINSNKYFKIGTEFNEMARHKNEARFYKKHPPQISCQKTFAVSQDNVTTELSKEVKEKVKTEEINLKYDTELNPKTEKFILHKKGLVKSNPRFFQPSFSSQLNPSAQINRKTSKFVSRVFTSKPQLNPEVKEFVPCGLKNK